MRDRFAAYILHVGKILNEKVLAWHLLEDLPRWGMVLIVSVVPMFAELSVHAPLLSIGIMLITMFNVQKHIKQTLSLFLQGGPDTNARGNR